MSRITVKKQAASPGTPSVGNVSLWRKDNGDWVETDENGVETVVGPVSGSSTLVSVLSITVGNGVDVILAGTKGYSAPLPYGGTIQSWTIAEVSQSPISGSIVIDIGKDTTGNYPPTFPVDSVAGTEKPSLTSQKTNSDSSLSSWTTTFNAGDCFAFNVESVALCKKVQILIKVIRS